MKLHRLYQYDETGQGRFETSWYGDVYVSGGMLRMNIKGMPFNSLFNMDARVIPQLIEALKEIQNERTN